MVTILIIAAVLLIFIGFVVLSLVEISPEGHEDKRGWHKGKGDGK